MSLILFLSPVESLSNGATRSLLATITQSSKKGYETVLIAPRPGELTRAAKKIGTRVYIVGFDWWVRPSYGELPEYESSALTNANAVTQITDILKKESPLACVTCTATVPWLAYAASLTRTLHIWHIYEHLTDPSPTFLYRLRHLDVLKTIHLLSDKVFAVSNSVKRQLERDYPGFDNITVMHIYTPPLSERKASASSKNLFNDADAFKVVLLGNVEPNKGQFDAVKAVHRLISAGENINLRLVGGINSDNYANEIKKYIKDHKLNSYIKLTGFVSNPSEYLKVAEVSLICSLQDAFPLTAIESLQLGTPVIGSKSGGVEEMLGESGAYGMLYTPGNIKELAEKIRILANNRDMVKKMGERAKKHVEKEFSSIEKVNKPLFDYLESLDDPSAPSALDLSPLNDLLKTFKTTSDELKITQSRAQDFEAKYLAVVNSKRWQLASKIADALPR